MKQEIENSTAEYTVIGAGIMMIVDDRVNEYFYPGTREFILS